VHYRYKFIWLKLVFLSRMIKWVVGLACIGLFLGGYVSLTMPGQSHNGELPPLTFSEKALMKELQEKVKLLAEDIGERNLEKYGKLLAAAEYIEQELKNANYSIRRQPYRVDGKWCYNIEAEIHGSIKVNEIVVVGSHYDTAPGCAGANDNASGVAAALALARRFAGKKITRTLRFVFFVNETPPYSQTEYMGSFVYARRCAEQKEKIVAMLDLESLGYYSDEPGSQHYPLPVNFFYPHTGNFIGFLSNAASRTLAQSVVGSFRRNAQFPSQGILLPESTNIRITSDQWAFWQHGYPALLVTDTAPYRYPHHLTGNDIPANLNYEYMTRVVAGLEKTLGEIARVFD
jgi:Zn-dependent M28 family amino/carboxypeptidase